MATLSEDEQELIHRDREVHPECFYSTALSKSCRSINGDSKCEIIKKIYRQCPNSRKELISNRTEIMEDEHGGESTADDFDVRERMGPIKGVVMTHSGEQFPGAFFQQRGDDFHAQMSPFDFLRQEMLRPFEEFLGTDLWEGDNLNPFEGLKRQFKRMPEHPPFPQPDPPHYSFQPSQEKDGRDDDDARKRAQSKGDLFAGYSGRVDEI
ncbi:hypothetical protein CCR75_000308 [Bremia lactucae]|uniref:Uncharacterized protein n=1 Tax=Bremia lactucae TaxID=4779 RepID=A0A976FLZ7_BRELC|nr:hypothetical protein CCR75_000308 [Bremia lactucae]